ncbi:hypothetical protein N7465_010767 [Penicillium sp. CMV-2018d]|nr:hypothetical protein N7465_010767 [Penicillium sp. CMV-2018d]
MYVAVVIARALEKMRGISTQMLPKRSRCTIAPHVTGIELDTHLVAPALCLTVSVESSSLGRAKIVK